MLEVRNLNVAFGQSQAHHGLDITVQPGEIVAVVGDNVMGKTTLMKFLIGVIPAKSGQIIANGANVTALHSHARVANGLSHVPQGRQIFGTMTVEENIKTGLSATSKSLVPDKIYGLFPKYLGNNRVGERS